MMVLQVNGNFMEHGSDVAYMDSILTIIIMVMYNSNFLHLRIMVMIPIVMESLLLR